jgi:hypothetical protein
MLFLVSLVLAMPLTSCGQRLEGEGPVVTREFDLGRISSVGLGIRANVFINKGTPGKVVIEGQENMINSLEKEVRGEEWEIDFDSRNVGKYKDMTITITTDKLEELAIGGSGSIKVNDPFDMDDLEMAIAGSGDIEISGTANKTEIAIAGSGDVRASGLAANECEISIAGSGDAYIEVKEEMEVSIAGSGNVHYKGRPRMSTSIAGSGNVKSMSNSN